jgi:hypothetical protein
MPAPSGPPGARWDTPAAGVPRRFGVGVLMVLVTMFAVLFAVMQTAGVDPAIFIIIALLFAGVSLGQVLLFQGRYPRAASIWVGAVLFPIEMLGYYVYVKATGYRAGTAPAVFGIMFSIPFGACLGYLAGGLTAGVFFLIDAYNKWASGKESAQNANTSSVVSQSVSK